jgi:hypothetical protein
MILMSMRSGLSLKDELQKPDSNALHLTDHDIFAKGVTFSYIDLSIGEKVGLMKLRSYLRLDSGKLLSSTSPSTLPSFPESSFPLTTLLPEISRN